MSVRKISYQNQSISLIRKLVLSNYVPSESNIQFIKRKLYINCRLCSLELT